MADWPPIDHGGRLGTSPCVGETASATAQPHHEEGEGAKFRSGTYRRVLFETPSGFAMFDVAEKVLRHPENIWVWFTRLISSARKVIHTLGFVKVDKSVVARASDVGLIGTDLGEFILEFCNGRVLTVPDLRLKAVIEARLKITCWFEEQIVHELMWGLNYILAAFVPEEKVILGKEPPLSNALKRKIEIYGINVSQVKIDREFIDMVGYMATLEYISKVIPEFLHCKFDRYFVLSKIPNDLEFAKAVAKRLSSSSNLSAEMIRKNDKYSKEGIMLLIDGFIAIPERKMYAMSYLKSREVMSSVDDPQETTSNVDCGNRGNPVPGVVGFWKKNPWVLFSCGIAVAAIISYARLKYK